MSDYAKGFKDGFAAGLEEGKKLVPSQKRLDDYLFGNRYTTSPNFTLEARDTCPKCGIKISGLMNYTCSSVNCPTFYTATCSVGAVGSDVVGSNAVGANGPAGYSGPSSEEEYDRLNRYNQVWINGQWAELGG
jgi:hypothetical protein